MKRIRNSLSTCRVLPTTTTASSSCSLRWDEETGKRRGAVFPHQLHQNRGTALSQRSSGGRSPSPAAALRRLQRQSSTSTQSNDENENWNVDSETGTVSFRGEAPVHQVKVGLEIHVQLCHPQQPTGGVSTLKLFSPPLSSCSSSSSTNLHAPHTAPPPPNVSFHPQDAAVPGFLPRLSHYAVESALQAAVCLQCDVPSVSRFERKHYFYPDLPAGYQITQQRWPLAVNGSIEIPSPPPPRGKQPKSTTTAAAAAITNVSSTTTHCRIERIQLEQDTAKTLQRGTMSLVDLDRAGTALVEVVTAPDLHSARQARRCAEQVHHLLTSAKITHGRMEWGEFRVDVNVNLVDSVTTGMRQTARVEVKNLNSFQQVEAAIQYEAQRQALLLRRRQQTVESALVEETRTWNAATCQTELLRTKDTVQDYRFLPEPDLPPLVLDRNWIETLRNSLPELPKQTQFRLVHDYGLPEYLAGVLVRNGASSVSLFEQTLQLLSPDAPATSAMALAPAVANLIVNEIFALLKEVDVATSSSSSMTTMPPPPRLSPEQLAEIVTMLELEESISTPMAKKLLAVLIRSTDDTGSRNETAATVTSPREVAAQRGWRLVTDSEALQRVCRQVIADHPRQLHDYLQGHTNVFRLFVGRAMKATKGNAHPERLREALQDVLDRIQHNEQPPP